eukprot:6473178-Amphidinium_carterae.1
MAFPCQLNRTPDLKLGLHIQTGCICGGQTSQMLQRLPATSVYSDTLCLSVQCGAVSQKDDAGSANKQAHQQAKERKTETEHRIKQSQLSSKGETVCSQDKC